MPQLSVIVYPTRTIYQMLCGESWNIKTPITVTFTTAQLPSNLTLMARPVSYATFYSPPKVRGRDAAFPCAPAAVLPKADAFPCAPAAVLPKTDAFPCAPAAVLTKTGAFALWCCCHSAKD